MFCKDNQPMLNWISSSNSNFPKYITDIFQSLVGPLHQYMGVWKLVQQLQVWCLPSDNQTRQSEKPPLQMIVSLTTFDYQRVVVIFPIELAVLWVYRHSHFRGQKTYTIVLTICLLFPKKHPILKAMVSFPCEKPKKVYSNVYHHLQTHSHHILSCISVFMPILLLIYIYTYILKYMYICCLY